MLLEREQALDAVAELVRSTSAGAGATVLVEGAAGTGKTALLAAARASATRAGWTVLAATGGELEQDLPWGVVRDLLRRALLTRDESWPPAVLAALGAENATMPDDIAALLPLTEACAAIARDRPVLLMVDDAHWCDLPSAQWLAYLTPRLVDTSVGLLVAARPDDLRRPRPLTALRVRDGVNRIELGPLSQAATRQLIRAAVPTAKEDVLEACWTLTGGNQFLVVQLAHELATAARVTAEDVQKLGLRTAERALERRLATAGPAAARLARAVAVLGAEADTYDAATLAELPPAAAALAADALRAAGLIGDRGPGRVAFIHPLFRLAVERAILPGQRSLDHLHAARHLHGRGAPVEQIGAQLLAVEPGADPWVRERLAAAADAAERAGAPSVARGLLARAQAEHLGTPDPTLLARYGRVTLAIDPSAAVAPLQAALDATPDTAARVALALALADALQKAQRTHEIPALLDQVGAGLTPEGPEAALYWRLQAELLAQAAMVPQLHQLRRDRLHQLQPRLRGDHAEELLVLAQLALDEVTTGRADRARTLAEQAWDQGRLQKGLTNPTTPTGMWLLYTLLYADAGELAESIALTWLADANERGQGAQTVYLNVLLAELRWRQGRLRESERAARAAWDLARVPGRSFTGWWIAVAVLAQALLARGHSNAAHDLLARNDLLDGPPPLVWSMPSLGAVRAQVLLAAGQVEQGVAELHNVDTWLRSLNFPSPGGWWYPGDLVEGQIRLDRRDKAIEVAQRWHAETAAFCSPVVTGQALRAVGLACNDIERLEEAVSQLEHTSAQLAYARALLDFASALRRRGQPTRARPLLRRTLDLATTADARALAAQAHREFLATGARPRRTAITGIDALTASERRVAEMAAQGHSNPEIASRLYITRKTVEKHLAAAFNKLGIHTRHALPNVLGDSQARTTSRHIDRPSTQPDSITDTPSIEKQHSVDLMMMTESSIFTPRMPG